MKRILLSIFLLGTFCSCEDFIDLQPLDRITMDDYWGTATELEYYTRQFYPAFCSQSQMLDMAFDNDDMINGSPSIILNGTRTKTTGNWVGEWANIRKVNLFSRIIRNARALMRTISNIWERLISLGLGSTLTC